MAYPANQLNQLNTLAQPQAPLPHLAAHAQSLHEDAANLAELNVRLANAIDRISGPVPEPTQASKDQPSPNGALLVAQFGAERIRQSIGRLAELVTRLEGIA